MGAYGALRKLFGSLPSAVKQADVALWFACSAQRASAGARHSQFGEKDLGSRRPKSQLKRR